MANSEIKVSDLPTAANVASTDRVVVLRNPASSPSVRTVAISTLGANLVLSNSAPANSSANGVIGTLRYDSTHLYLCVANNTWVRSTLASW